MSPDLNGARKLEAEVNTTPANIDRAEIRPQADLERVRFLAGIVRDMDHTLLGQNTRDADLDLLCGAALRAKELLGVGPRSVCVNSSDVAYCAKKLADSGIIVCSVVGFPLGKMTTESKVFETKEAIKAGASEIDMVINVGALRSGRSDYVREEIRQIAEACHAGGAILKVIIETCSLDNDDQKRLACRLSEEAGADFVKTNTGTADVKTPAGVVKGGATVADVALMRSAVSPHIQVKAAGGMKTPEDAQKMREAGADRFGTSGLLKVILDEVEGKTAKKGDGPSY